MLTFLLVLLNTAMHFSREGRLMVMESELNILKRDNEERKVSNTKSQVQKLGQILGNLKVTLQQGTFARFWDSECSLLCHLQSLTMFVLVRNGLINQ